MGATETAVTRHEMGTLQEAPGALNPGTAEPEHAHRSGTRAASDVSLSMQPVAALETVSKQYPGGKALDELSFALYPGEIVALLGPNGAGKTTAIRILLGLTRRTGGRARLFGAEPGKRAARMRVGADAAGGAHAGVAEGAGTY